MRDMLHQRERLQEARQAKGLTQRQLAGRIGIQQTTIARLELQQHEPSLRVALALAAALDSTVERLFADKSPRAASPAGGVTHDGERTSDHEQEAA